MDRYCSKVEFKQVVAGNDVRVCQWRAMVLVATTGRVVATFDIMPGNDPDENQEYAEDVAHKAMNALNWGMVSEQDANSVGNSGASLLWEAIRSKWYGRKENGK